MPNWRCHGRNGCSPRPASPNRNSTRSRSVAARRLHRRAPGDRDRAGHRAGAGSTGGRDLDAGGIGDARPRRAHPCRDRCAHGRGLSRCIRAPGRRTLSRLGNEAVAEPDAAPLPDGRLARRRHRFFRGRRRVAGAPAIAPAGSRCRCTAACRRCRAPGGTRVRARRSGGAGPDRSRPPAQQRRAHAASSSRHCATRAEVSAGRDAPRRRSPAPARLRTAREVFELESIRCRRAGTARCARR